MASRLVPSVEVLTVGHLRGHVDVTDLVDDRIGTELYAGTRPAVWLSLVTGSEQVRNHLITQVVDVRSYGGNKADAELIARTVHAALVVDLPGTYAGAVVASVATTAMPGWNPDDGFTPPRPRYVGTYAITLHAT